MFREMTRDLHWRLPVERQLMLAPQTAQKTPIFIFWDSFGFDTAFWFVREKDRCPCARRCLFHLQKQFAVRQDRQRCHTWHFGAIVWQYV